MYKEASIYCRQYQDSDSDFLHGTPLDCFLVTPSEISTYKTADEVITGAMVGAFWGIMLASNITILVVVFQFDRTYTGNRTRRQVRMFGAKLKLMKSGLAVLVISSFFALTNFPLAYSWAAHIFHKEWNYTQHYYLVLLSFLSLFCHPWLYCLRMKSIRSLISGLKRRVLSVISFRSSSATGSVIGANVATSAIQ